MTPPPTRRALLLGAFGLVATPAALSLARDLSARTPPELLPPEQRADRIEVRKADRLLLLFRGEKELARYEVALGFAPEGHKTREGDGKTPEGRYRIDRKNPNSSYHLSLGLDYPRAADRDAAKRAGVSPGGDIFIHGLPNGWSGIGSAHRLRDWTAGCVAVTNAEIEEIWTRVAVGAPIDLLP
ncbi:MAG: L,D-transpeptidase family protein [Pseudomonadota bacterium]